MKFRISDIPPQGVSISQQASLEALNSRLNIGHASDIRFVSDPDVNVLLTRTIDGAEVRGTVKAQYVQQCGRCSDEVPRELSVDLNLIMKPKPLDTKGLDPAEYEDQIGMIYFEGEHVELETAVQDSLIVALSQFWSPPVEPNGTCSVCKRDRDPNVASAGDKASLGDIFKKAGIN